MKTLDLIGEFRNRYNKRVVSHYQDREDRNRWAASLLNETPGNNVLNLGGGGNRHLAKHLGSQWRVHELDMVGDCDTTLNLDEIDRLPFDDSAFDACCAFDVLEHLEHFHLIADEMHRVSRSTILISLPNSAVEMMSICRDIRNFNDPLENGVYSKYYGLPVVPPKDRHRWWLTFEDIVRYFLWFEKSKSCVVEFYIPDDDFTLKRKVFRFVAGERLYLTLCCSSIWIKIKK
jgi:hypothetical protein